MSKKSATPPLQRVPPQKQIAGLWVSKTETLWELEPGSTVTIGSDDRCDIVLDEAYASRKHCRVSLDENGLCTVQDLNSTNGTVINGLLFQGDNVPNEPLSLEVGDVLTIGYTELDAVDKARRVMLRGQSLTSVMVYAASKYGSPEKAADMLSTSASTIRRRRARQLERNRMVT